MLFNKNMVVGIDTSNNIRTFNSFKPTRNLPANNHNCTGISLPSKITPNYNIKTPQTYTKLKTYKLENGQEIHSYKLANGQKVLIAPMEVPVIHINTYVNTGSINETKENRGISHLTEHMLFNDKNGTDKVSDTINKLGGSSNGFTNFAQTYYSIKLPLFEDKDLEEGIKAEADIIQNPKFTEENLEKEKSIIKSEINMYNDIDSTKQIHYSVKNLYNLQEDAKDFVSGTPQDIDKIRLENVIDFHKKNYTPDNITTIITGNVNPEKTIQLTAKYFNTPIINKQNNKTQNPKPITKTQRKDYISKFNNSITMGLIGFDGFDNDDIKSKIAFQIISEYIDNYQNKFSENKSKIYCDTKLVAPNKNMVLVGLLSENENPESDLQNCMNKLKKFPIPTEEELLNAKENIKSNFSEDIEHPGIFNEILGENQFENIEQLQNNNKIVDSITREDIKNITQKYFNTNKASIIVTHPQNTTNEKIKKNYNTIHPHISFGSNNRIYNSKNIETFKLNNNIEVGFYDKPNAINTNIKIYIKPQKQIKTPIGCREVTNTILENLNTNAFGLRDNKQDSFINVNNGITITTESIADKTQNQCDFILSLMNIDTYIDNELVKTRKDGAKQYILNNQEHSIDISINKAGNYPDNKTILNNIENINSDNIKNYWSDIIKNSSITIAVTGPKNKIKNTVLNTVSGLGTVLNDDKKLTNTFIEDKNSTVTTNISDTNQSKICQYYKYKISGNLKDEMAFQTLSNILDKRLIQNLREKDKLGYRTNSNILSVGNTEIISATIQTDTDNNKSNIAKSINGINQQINTIVKGDITDEEVATAKKQLKQNILESSYQQKDINKSLLDGMLSPYGVDYVNKQLDTIESINKKDIITAANYVFNTKAQYIISAPKDALDYNKESLNLLGNVN